MRKPPLSPLTVAHFSLHCWITCSWDGKQLRTRHICRKGKCSRRVACALRRFTRAASTTEFNPKPLRFDKQPIDINSQWLLDCRWSLKADWNCRTAWTMTDDWLTYCSLVGCVRLEMRAFFKWCTVTVRCIGITYRQKEIDQYRDGEVNSERLLTKLEKHGFRDICVEVYLGHDVDLLCHVTSSGTCPFRVLNIQVSFPIGAPL